MNVQNHYASVLIISCTKIFINVKFQLYLLNERAKSLRFNLDHFLHWCKKSRLNIYSYIYSDQLKDLDLFLHIQCNANNKGRLKSIDKKNYKANLNLIPLPVIMVR